MFIIKLSIQTKAHTFILSQLIFKLEALEAADYSESKSGTEF